MRSAEQKIAIAVCALLLGACATSPSTHEPGLTARQTAPLPAGAEARFERALDLMQRDEKGAEALLLDLERDFPDLAGPCVNLGILYARSDRPAKAETAFLAALERNPETPAAHNGLGILYRRSGRFEEATAAYGEALAADPAYALAFFNRGVLNDLYLERPDAALGDYQRYQALQTETDERVAKWIDDLRLRIESRTAQAGSP